MNLQGIIAVAGKPGLWKALAQNKTGFVLESLDEKKTRLVVNISTAKLAALDEITIFGEDGDIKLTDVFAKMQGSASVPDAKSDGRTMREFFREVAPDHDEEKVYASDMKKILSWYHILKDMPLFTEQAATTQPAEEVSLESPDGDEAATPETVEEAVSEVPAAETPKAKKPKAAKKV
jgi:hypothetical protein